MSTTNIAAEPASDRMMLAAVLEEFKSPYVLKQIPQPLKAESQDILVKVLAASYCHTDAVLASGQLSQDLPRVGCHEFVGEVMEVGPDVSPSRNLTRGVRVGVPGRAYRPCGTCFECRHPGRDEIGYSPYCPKAGNLGLTRDGGFQEFCFVDSRQVAILPEGLLATQAAPLMCAGLTIWAALHHDKLQGARTIAIIGAGGGLGHLGVQFAAHLGMEVIAIDANDSAMGLLERLKADLGPVGSRVRIFDARKVDASEIKLSCLLNEGQEAGRAGSDAVIFLPESQKAFDMGMELLRNHGTMVVVSFPSHKLAISANDLVFRDISVVGSLVGRNHQLKEMLAFVVRHKISVDVRTFPLRDINKLVEESRIGASGKLVIDMAI